jgi:hypothetical protein
MNINEICNGIIRNVDAALGCAVVDLNSGLLLGVSHNVPYFTQSYLDAVAAAAVDMFRGRTISAVEEMLANMRGTSKKHLIKEIQMTTENTFHFMMVDYQQKSQLGDGMVLYTNGYSQINTVVSLVKRPPRFSKPRWFWNSQETFVGYLN